MPNPSWPHSTEPFESGPDYVALVIEWDELENTVTAVSERPSLAAPGSSLFTKLVLGAGALGALLLAGWGYRRLRHA
jgi:hypothetical protein